MGEGPVREAHEAAGAEVSSQDLEMVREAVSQLDSHDKIDYIEAVENLRKDIAHLEVGARVLMRKLETEKLCGMTHTEEINVWIASHKLREPPR